MSNDKLRPCPFCGGKVHIGNDSVENFIICEVCDARPYVADKGEVEHLIKMWNTRQAKNRCGNDKCNEINSGIDECIKPLIKALNDCGMETVASCCGHGNRHGNVMLRDGREILIAPDFETARQIDKHFPDIHGAPPQPMNKNK